MANLTLIFYDCFAEVATSRNVFDQRTLGLCHLYKNNIKHRINNDTTARVCNLHVIPHRNMIMDKNMCFKI